MSKDKFSIKVKIKAKVSGIKAVATEVLCKFMQIV